jgi:F-type H+-transporting ATPase subunit gamma
MPASLRELRERRNSASNIKKLTRAMELIAASRIIRAQQHAREAEPYQDELTRALSALATFSNVSHPLTTEADNPTRAAVLLIASDRGQAGAYSSAVLKEGEQLRAMLAADDKQVVSYLSGRKAEAFYNFRNRAVAGQWDGYSDSPGYVNARVIADALLEAFNQPTEDGGVDEIHIVYTRFYSMLTQRPEVIRLLPLQVVEGAERPDPGDLLPLYDFEPDSDSVLDQVLPLYLASRIHFCLLQAAASELAARQRAMKAATDNADDLIEKLTLEANQVRQAGITQEISEIVGGVEALADSGEEAD